MSLPAHMLLIIRTAGLLNPSLEVTKIIDVLFVFIIIRENSRLGITKEVWLPVITKWTIRNMTELACGVIGVRFRGLVITEVVD